MKLFELFATLGLDTGEFDKGVEGAGEKGKGLGEKIDKAMGVAKKAIVAVGIGAALTGLKNDLLAAADAGDKVDKASQQLGMSRKAYQEWGYVLAQNGADIDSMGASMKTLQNAMVQGTDATDAAFQALGLNVNAIKGMAPEDAFGAVVTALQGMPAGAEKTALAIDLLGKNAMELMPLLNQTAEGTDALKQEANDLGMVLSDEAIDSGVVFGDTLDRMKKSVAGVLTEGLSKLLPGITKFIDKLTPIINKILPKLIDAFGKVFEAIWPLIEGGLNFFADALDWVAENIDWLLPVVGALTAALLLLNIVMNANPIGLIIIGIAALAAGIVLLTQNFDKVTEWLAGVGDWIYTNVIEPVVGFFAMLWGAVSGGATSAWNWIVSVWTAVSTWFNDNVIVPVSDFFTKLWSAISTAATDTWDAIVLIWKDVSAWFNDNIITPVSDFFADLWTEVSSAASDAWDAIVAVWELVSTWFAENVTTPVSSAFSAFWLTVSGLFSTLWAWAKGVWEGAATWFSTNITQPIQKIFTDMWSAVSSAASAVWTSITGWINGIISLANTAITTIKSMLGLKGWTSSDAQSAFESSSGGKTWEQVVAETEGGYATGLDYVPSRGKYTLDPGEAVLTKLDADNWRSGRMQGGIDLTGLASAVYSAVVSGMSNIRVVMDSEQVGNLTASAVSAAIGSAVIGRRHA